MLALRNVGEDRRGTPRTPAVFAVGLESDKTGERHGVTRDLSTTGLLIVTPTQYSKGDRLKLRVHVGASLVDVAGKVMRVDENPVSSPELWRWRVGVQLDQPLPVEVLSAHKLS